MRSTSRATLVSLDRRGFKLRLRTGERVQALRAPFPRDVTSAEQCRAAFMELLREA